MTPFSRTHRWPRVSEDLFAAELPEDWLQGRTAFGGLLAAVALTAIAERWPDRPVRSLHTRFLDPLGAGPAELRLRMAREGRSVAHVEARFVQGERLCAAIDATLAAPRASGLALAGPPLPEGPDPEGLTPLPYFPGLGPVFTQHLELCWTEGGLPYSGSPGRVLGGWGRVRDPEAAGPALTLAMLDAWPPVVLQGVSRVVPASTIHWTAHLVDAAGPRPGEWLRFRAEAPTAADGYATELAWLWGRDGRLLGWSEQLLAVFDGPRPA